MPRARNQQVDLTETSFYHCVSRCVRRAFLCGKDAYSGQSFEHRKQWIIERLMALAAIFAIDICAYGIMSNHLHLVLRVAVERARTWSDAEVVERYTKLFPTAKSIWIGRTGKAQAELVAVWRERLCSISWMMRALNEWIARRANKEDECSGRFWEGRFSSQPLLDDIGLLACMAYVDLNPKRAGVCDNFEDDEHTSIYERIAAIRKLNDGAISPDEVVPNGLVPFEDQAPAAKQGEVVAPRIPMSILDYIALLEWTAGSADLSGTPRLLARLGIDPTGWLAAMTQHGIRTRAALGRMKRMEEFARTRGRSRVSGRGLMRSLLA